MNKPVTKLDPETEVEIKDADPLALMRRPFPANAISKLPKETGTQAKQRKADQDNGKWPDRCKVCDGYHHPKAVHLDYVGHAALTDRLLDSDPAWNWRPMAFTPEGLPLFDRNGGLWMYLTVGGVERIGYGCADGKTGGDAIKEIIGDALRNSGMRFGAALDLWHKGDLHADEAEPEVCTPARVEEMAVNLLRGCGSKELFSDAWGKNKDNWRRTLGDEAYARLVAEMKRLAAGFQKNEPSRPPPADEPLPIGDDDIPEEFR